MKALSTPVSRSCSHTSSSSGALDSLAAVLKTLGVKDTEIEPHDLTSATGLSNISFFLPKMTIYLYYMVTKQL